MAYGDTHYLIVEPSRAYHKPFAHPEIFVQLLEVIKNLELLDWNVGPISADIVLALQRFHPRCTLRLFKWTRFDSSLERFDESEIALSNSRNLTHLRMVFPPYDFDDDDRYFAWEAFRDLLAANRNLKLASFLATGSSTRREHASKWVRNVLNSNTMEYATRLGMQTTNLKSLTIDTPDDLVANRDLFKLNTAIDLSAVESLKLPRRNFHKSKCLETVATLLPNLRHISLNFSTLRMDVLPAVKTYLLSCAPAQTLSLWAWCHVNDLAALLSHHGQSLQTLELHSNQTSRCIRDRVVMSAADIRLIDETCPNLVDLTIDLNVESIESAPTPTLEMKTDLSEALQSLVQKRPLFRRLQIYHQAEVLGQMEQPVFARYYRLPQHSLDEEVQQENDNHPLEDEEPSDRPKKSDLERIRYREECVSRGVNPYVNDLWKTLYALPGTFPVIEKRLDVKFGDWGVHKGFFEEETMAFCRARTHDRDDRKGEAFVHTKVWSCHENSVIWDWGTLRGPNRR